MLTVPLLSGDRAIGVLQAINKQVGPFLPTDLALMESIAAIATAAIVRGHRHSELETIVGNAGQDKVAMLNVAEELAAELDKQVQSSPGADLDRAASMARQLIQLVSG